MSIDEIGEACYLGLKADKADGKIIEQTCSTCLWLDYQETLDWFDYEFLRQTAIDGG